MNAKIERCPFHCKITLSLLTISWILELIKHIHVHSDGTAFSTETFIIDDIYSNGIREGRSEMGIKRLFLELL